MRIHLRSKDHALRVAKTLQPFFPELPLGTAQNWVAQMLGYRDLHELAAVTASHQGPPSPSDDEAGLPVAVERWEYQTEQLMAASGISSMAAHLIVQEIFPSGTRGSGRHTLIAGLTVPQWEAWDKVIHVVIAKDVPLDLDRIMTMAIPLLRDKPTASALLPNTVCEVVLKHLDAYQQASGETPLMRAFLEAAGAYRPDPYGYSLANVLAGSSRIEDRREAERIFLHLIESSTTPKAQAASLVNYAPLIRDGVLSGQKDWPAAVAIYERAAKMGMVLAMFNAANVSRWIADEGDRSYAQRAAYWFQYALDYVQAGRPTLDFNGEETMREVLSQCRKGLAALHIDNLIPGADVNTGIALLDGLAESGDETAAQFRQIGYRNRLSRLRARPQAVPAANWQSVFRAMGWQVDAKLFPPKPLPGVDGLTATCFRVGVEPGKRTRITVVVMNDPVLPMHRGDDVLDVAATVLGEQFRDEGMILLDAKAVFGENEGTVFVPCRVQLPGGGLWLAALAPHMTSPLPLLQQAREETYLGTDPRYGAGNAMLAIAYNALSEGMAPAEALAATPTPPWVRVGTWCMPFFSEDILPSLGIRLPSSPSPSRAPHR